MSIPYVFSSSQTYKSYLQLGVDGVNMSGTASVLAASVSQHSTAVSDSALCFPQYFVKLLMAKGTLKKDIKDSIFSSIEAIYSVNQ